jgi:hypothetical protein
VDVLDDPAGHRPRDDRGKGNRHHEKRRDLGSLASREPAGEIEDHAGEETRFEHAEQQARDRDVGRSLGKECQCCNRAPHYDDEADPAARAQALKREVGRNLAQQIRRKKHRCDRAELGRGNVQLPIHLQGRETDIHPVEIVEEVKNERERHDLPHHRSNDLRPKFLTLQKCLPNIEWSTYLFNIDNTVSSSVFSVNPKYLMYEIPICVP